MTTVHQFHPVLAPGDAMSNHVFALERRLREWGHEPASYADDGEFWTADRALLRSLGKARPAYVRELGA